MIILLLLLLLLLYLFFYNIKESFIVVYPYDLIIGATIKNVEKYIKKALNDIDTCGSKFKSYKVVIYENDSTDKTRDILNDNKKNNYYYIFENNIKEPLRTVRLENARNKVLNKARELGGDYLLLLDLDDVNQSGKFVDSIDECFKYDVNTWDAMFGNQSDKYYDIWALRNKRDVIDDCWKLTKKEPYNIYKHVTSKQVKYEKDKLIDVSSAFGGAGLYKLSAIPYYCKYVGTHSDGTEKCEHVEFNECIYNNGGKLYINTNFLTN